jgi:beta-lactamase class A
MNHFAFRLLLALTLSSLLCGTAFADFRRFQAIPLDPRIDAELARMAGEVFAEFPKITRGNLSFTLIDMTDPAHLRRGGFDATTPYHPASVVKMFYLVEAWHQHEEGRLTFDAELQSAIHDMIVDSSNDATSYVVDRLTGTTSGPELSPRALRRFAARRGVVNRYLASLGYSDINATGKTFCDNVFGRDKQLLGPKREGRNRFYTDAVAAMLLSIVRHEAVTPAATEEMLKLMSRELPAAGESSTNYNIAGFTGQSLPPGSRLWSKPGDTSEVRHDATYVELPNGRKYLFVVFSRGDAANLHLLPAISTRLLTYFAQDGSQ